MSLGDFDLELTDDSTEGIQEWDRFSKENKYYLFQVNIIKQRINLLRDELEAGTDKELDEIREIQGELFSLRWFLGLPSALQAEINNFKKGEN